MQPFQKKPSFNGQRPRSVFDDTRPPSIASRYSAFTPVVGSSPNNPPPPRSIFSRTEESPSNNVQSLATNGNGPVSANEHRSIFSRPQTLVSSVSSMARNVDSRSVAGCELRSIFNRTETPLSNISQTTASDRSPDVIDMEFPSPPSSRSESTIPSLPVTPVPTEGHQKFSDREMETETINCDFFQDVFRIQSEKKLQKIDDLFLYIGRFYGSKGQSNPFATTAELHDWFMCRSHLFEYDIISGTFMNTGFGYRNGIHELILYVYELTRMDEECTQHKLFIKYHDLNIYQPMDPYSRSTGRGITRDRKDPLNDTHFREFGFESSDDLVKHLKRNHQKIFNFEERGGKMIISLDEKVYSVPSIWKSSCWPKLPAEKIYIDSSRQYSFFVQLVSVQNHYAKGTIQFGVFRNRHVYILPKDVGMSSEAFTATFFVKALCTVVAHMTLNSACEFKAVKIMPLGSDKEIVHKKVQKRSLIADSATLFDHIFAENTPEVQPSSEGRSSPSNQMGKECNSSKQKIIAREFIDAERTRQQFVAGFFSAGLITEEKLQVDYTARLPDSPFASFKELCGFIEDRKYLYEAKQYEDEEKYIFNFVEADIHQVYRDLIKFLDKCGIISLKNLTEKLKQGEGSDCLQQVVLEDKLDDYLEHLMVIIRQIPRMDKSDPFVVLQGTYSSIDGIFVPFVFVK